MIEYRHWKIVDQGLLAKAMDWRERRGDVIKAWGEFARANGGDENSALYSGGRNFLGFSVSGKAPEGFKQVGRRGASYITPKISTRAGKAAKEAMRALPKIPERQEVNDWIGWPANYYREDSESKFSCGLADCQLTWAGDDFFICLQMIGIFGMPAGPDALQFMAEWPVPAGCEEVTGAQYQLVFAKHQAESEAQRAA